MTARQGGLTGFSMYSLEKSEGFVHHGIELRREILLPHGLSRKEVRPERPERRLRLVSAIARGRRWLDEIVSGSVSSVAEIALRERCETLR